MALAYDWQPRSQPSNRYVFRVSDITTLLSVATRLIDFVAGMWTGILAWRCALILLENRGLSVKHLGQIVGGLKLGPLKRLRGLEWPIAVVLLFIFPQAFIEPLFSGSVNWNFAVDYAPSIQVPNVPVTVQSQNWFWYLTQGITRKQYVRQATGLAGIMWSATDSESSKGGTVTSPGGVTCRHVMPNRMPVNSTLLDATVPCIQIHNITWPTEHVPDDIRDYAWSKGDDLGVFGNNPFDYIQSGVAALFSRSEPSWNTPSTVKIHHNNITAAFPTATKWSGNMTVFLLLARQRNTNCSPVRADAFGNSSYITNHLSNVFPADSNSADETCYTYGTVHFTAGVMKAPKSSFVSDQVVEYNPGAAAPEGAPRPTEDEIAAAIEPSIWTREALWLMPDVMADIAVMNTSLLPTWENLDNYTATLIRYAYLANWDALHASFDQDDTAMLTAQPAEPRLRASVSLTRLFVWFAVTLLVPATGVIVGFVHSRYSQRGMIGGTVPLLFIGSSEILERYPDLSAMGDVTEEDEQRLSEMVLDQVSPGPPDFRLRLGTTT